MTSKTLGLKLLLIIALIGLIYPFQAYGDSLDQHTQDQRLLQAHDVVIKAIDDTPDANDKITLLHQAIGMIKESGAAPHRKGALRLINRSIGELKKGDPDHLAMDLAREAAERLLRL